MRLYQVIQWSFRVQKIDLSACRNLSGHFILCGIGAARASNGTFYLTQLFAAWDLKIWRSSEGWQVSMRCVSAASMFHVLEELFDFRLWESARGIEGKPSPHVSQPNAPMPSLLHYVFSILGSRTCWESFGNFRCRVQVTRAAIRLHTSAKSRKLCAAKKKREYVLSFCDILYFCIFVVCWYDFPSRQKQYCSFSVMPCWIT